MLLLASAHALAADIHLELSTDDGVSESASWKSTETYTNRFGPVSKGSRSTVYTVTVQPSVFDPLQGFYKVELNVCMEWTKGSKSDRSCIKREIPAPQEGQPHLNETEVKAPGAGKFAWTTKTWFTGESPPVGAGPQKVEEPPEE